MSKKLTRKQEAWVKALESGEYPQAKRRLRTKAGYCCLGVACELSGLSTWVPVSYSPSQSPLTYLGEVSIVPTAVAKKLRLRAQHGQIHDKYVKKFHEHICALGYTGTLAYNDLIHYNDQGATFKQIAATMRAYPGAVFV